MIITRMIFFIVLAYIGTALSPVFAMPDSRLSAYESHVNLSKYPGSANDQPAHSPQENRQGGGTIETAFVIPSIPFADSGSTCEYDDYYNFQCPSQSAGPEVFYVYTSETDGIITLDLCPSTFDTVLGIMDDQLNLIACNDDYYFDEDSPCGQYVSKIEQFPVEAGATYYFVVDGWAGPSCGDYLLSVSTYVPCQLVCDGVAEGEPALYDGYFDEFNNGCNGGSSNFQSLSGDQNGDLIFCGKSGWHQGPNGENGRDTDWFVITVGETGVVEWFLETEQRTLGFLLGPQDCESVGVVQTISTQPCLHQGMVIEREAGSVLWLWVGAGFFNPPDGFVGHEYNYISTFTGLAAGTVETERTSWGGLKSKFRNP